MKTISIVFLFFVFTGCSSGPVPNNVLQPEKMQQVVYDLFRADEFVSNFVSKDSTADLKKKRSILYEQVFKLHNTTRKDFYASYRYYQQHPDVQKALFDSLNERLNHTKIDTGGRKGNLKL